MSTKTFTYPLALSPPEFLRKAQARADDAGAAFTGDESTGSFEAMGVKGAYKIEGKTIVVTITKPMLFPWSLVEQKVKEFFLGM